MLDFRPELNVLGTGLPAVGLEPLRKQGRLPEHSGDRIPDLMLEYFGRDGFALTALPTNKSIPARATVDPAAV